MGALKVKAVKPQVTKLQALMMVIGAGNIAVSKFSDEDYFASSHVHPLANNERSFCNYSSCDLARLIQFADRFPVEEILEAATAIQENRWDENAFLMGCENLNLNPPRDYSIEEALAYFRQRSQS